MSFGGASTNVDRVGSEATEQQMRPVSRGVRTYKDAINALNSLQSNFASVEARKAMGNDQHRNEQSINGVYEFSRRIGYRPLDYNRLNIVHVTGTKGKGSACAFTESILGQYHVGCGGPIRKIGLFTSPHLKTVRERIRIDGKPINELKFTKYFFEVWDKLSETQSSPTEFPELQPSDIVKPMYFKYLTLLSFHVFMSEGVDTAIYEVGVGGQYDSTNIIEKPTVTGITSMGIDHTSMLGKTIESITWNKTGIFKQGCPAAVSEQKDHPESLEIIKQRAKELGVSRLDFVDSEFLLPTVELGLAGLFQRQNAALAVKLAATHLSALGVPASELPSFDNVNSIPDKFLTGLAETSWDGRCQIIRNKPNYENITWYIDGAHTLESIKVSSEWLKSTLVEKTKNTKRTRILLFNQQNRENATSLLASLYENLISPDFKFDHVVFTTNVTWSDGKYSDDLVSMNSSKDAVDKLVVQQSLAETWNKLDNNNHSNSRKHVFHDIETGINFIKSLTDGNAGIDVFVCGSLHLVGGFLVVIDGKAD